MAQKKKRPSKRFGIRYGRTIREKIDKVENMLKQKHACPYCSRKKVSRISAGIWFCKNCNAKFTGRAYSPTQDVTILSSKEENISESTSADIEFYAPKKPKKEKKQEPSEKEEEKEKKAE